MPYFQFRSFDANPSISIDFTASNDDGRLILFARSRRLDQNEHLIQD